MLRRTFQNLWRQVFTVLSQTIQIQVAVHAETFHTFELQGTAKVFGHHAGQGKTYPVPCQCWQLWPFTRCTNVRVELAFSLHLQLLEAVLGALQFGERHLWPVGRGVEEMPQIPQLLAAHSTPFVRYLYHNIFMTLGHNHLHRRHVTHSVLPHHLRLQLQSSLVCLTQSEEVCVFIQGVVGLHHSTEGVLQKLRQHVLEVTGDVGELRVPPLPHARLQLHRGAHPHVLSTQLRGSCYCQLPLMHRVALVLNNSSPTCPRVLGENMLFYQEANPNACSIKCPQSLVYVSVNPPVLRLGV
mmetsp:Transcript_36765/g.48430  ORF Transcript_36765/g.48430 Transcript_36765/m.48430 type:complete len:298 (+) Transcript_36765:221-1114(+)